VAAAKIIKDDKQRYKTLLQIDTIET